MSLQDKIGKHWSERQRINKDEKNLILRWWQSESIIKRINYRICNEYISGASKGLTYLLKKEYNSRIPFKKGIAVGCGIGKKELILINEGFVDHFDLFELSNQRIEEGLELANKMGLSDKINFVKGDAFDLVRDEDIYDFIHWNNSLHHMMNVTDAVAWSYRILKKGGLFYMDDYVGPNRLQWTNKMLELASAFRKTLPEQYLLNPRNPEKLLNIKMTRPNRDKIIEDDPSEAADSENILLAVNKYFPDAYIKKTGGVIYHLAMTDIIHNFDPESDSHFFDLMMLVDDICTNLGETHYAVALGVKSK